MGLFARDGFRKYSLMKGRIISEAIFLKHPLPKQKQ